MQSCSVHGTGRNTSRPKFSAESGGTCMTMYDSPRASSHRFTAVESRHLHTQQLLHSTHNNMRPTPRTFAQGGFVSRSLEEFKRLSQFGRSCAHPSHATPAN
jgi:hypothetical protein